MGRVLITGGAGFVGRHFVRHFLEQGYEVVCVDLIAPFTGGIDPKDGWPLFDPREYSKFTFHRTDCRQYFKTATHEYFDYVLHLAAMVGGRLMIENHPLAVADDLSIDSEYWQWAKVANPGKSVMFSSSAAYPIKFQRSDGYKLLTEDMISFSDDIGFPDLSYGWAKLTCEYLGKLAFERHGLKSVVYRPFSGYGEDQDDTYPFPSICKRALASKDKHNFMVWGSGLQMRDFIHIDDCVRGVVTTMDKVNDGGGVNLSTGRLTSFKEFARIACEQIGFSPEVNGTSDKPEGVFARGGDTSYQKELGFQHSIKFEDGVARALKYFSGK